MASASPVATTQRFRNYVKRYMGKNRLYSLFEYNTVDIVKHEDDFLGDTLESNLYTVANGGGASAASPTITAGGANGYITGTTGTAGDNTASSEIALGLNWYGNLNATMLVRLQLSAITGVKCEVGFTDALDDAGAVATKATPTLTATDCAVWCFDTTDIGSPYWEGIAANNGSTAPATTMAAAIAPVATTYEWLMVELRDSGIETTPGTSDHVSVVRYSRYDANGGRTYRSDWQAAGPNANIGLTPWIYVEARNATSKNILVDYLGVWQRRTTTDG